MNINFPVYGDTHHVTNCIHDHGTPAKQLGGMRSQAVLEEVKNKQPQTLQDLIQNMEASSDRWRNSQEQFGLGKGLGDGGNSFAEENKEALAHFQSEKNIGNRTVIQKGIPLLGTLLNVLPMPAEIKRRFLPLRSNLGQKKVSPILELSAKGQKENKYFSGQTQAKQLYRRILEWVQIRRPLRTQEPSSQETDKICIGEEYLLDSYDRKGQYHQLERKGMLEEAWDKRA